MKLFSRHLLTALVLELIVVVLAYLEAQGDVVHFFKASARLSGRVSLLYFAVLFVYSTVQSSIQDNETMQTKFVLARNFAIVHIFHWVMLATALKLSGAELVPFRLAGGALAYILIAIYPFILKDTRSAKHLKWIQPVYLNYVWLIFLITYLTRISGKANGVTGDMFTYQVLFAMTLVLMLWRIFVCARLVVIRK